MELRRRFRVRALIALATAAQLLAISFGVSTILHSSPTDAAQQVPYKINFQGRLTDNSGNVLSDGLYNVKFRLWTLASGGSNVWEEDRVITGVDNRIQITNGLFNIQFGDLTALSPSLFVTGSGSLYLEVELPTPGTASCATNGCAVFTEGAMTPRQTLASSPYAMNSDTLDGLDSSDFGQIAANNTFTGANLFAPTTSSTVALTVKATTAGSTNSLEVFDSSGSRQAFFDATGALTLSQAISAPTTTNTINGLIINAGALSNVTGYAQASGSFLQSGSGTFGTGTGAVSLNGDTTVAAGKNLILPSGTGTFQQTFASPTAAASGQVLAFTNSNTVAAGVTMQGINITPAVNAPTSGTNILNIVNFAAGNALTAAENANGLNFASAVGYTNFIKTPTAVLSSAGAFTGVVALTVTTTTATALVANTVTTGIAVSATGLTTSVAANGAIVVGGVNTTTGVGYLFNTTANAGTTQKAINITGAAAAVTADVSGALINVTPTRTLTAAATRADSLNYLNLTRSITTNNAAAVYNITGALANLQSSCTQTLGSCTDTSNILNLNQQYATASGSILNVQGAGTGNLASLDASNASANGVAVDVQSSGTGQYVLKLTSNNAATNILYARADGRVGIGNTAPSTALDVSGTINGTAYSVGGTSGVGSTVSCGASQAVTAAVFTGGFLTTAPTCSTIAGTGAATDLSNLVTTNINQTLLSNANNTLDLGSTSDVWQNVFTGNIDAGTTTTALTVGTAATTTAITIGRSGLQVSVPGGLTTSGSAIATANGALTLGSGNITTTGTIGAGAITGTSLATSSNGTINSGSGTISTTGALNGGTVVATTSITSPTYIGTGAVSVTSGAASALTLDSTSGNLIMGANTTAIQKAATVFAIDLATASTSTLTVKNSNGANVANLTVTGSISSVGLNAGTGAITTSGNITTTGAGTIASASTVSGTTLNGTTGLNTGATGGTQRIDASGNMVNIGNITQTGTYLLQNTADSSTAFRVLTSGGSPRTVLNVDTTNTKLTLDSNLIVNSSVSVPSITSVTAGANSGGSLSGAPGTTYFYKISAIVGTETASSGETWVNSSSFTPLSAPSAPSAAAGASGGISGTYTYKYTFVTANGETTASLASGSVSVSNKKINVTIANGPTGTTGKKIYRTISGPGPTWLLVTTIADNTTTSYIDTTADGSLGVAAPGANTATTNLNNVTVTFPSFPSATSYRIYRGTSTLAEDHYQTTASTPFADTGAIGTAGTPLDATAGRVGIGTSTPGYALDVAGNISASNAYIQSGNVGQTSSCGAGSTFSGFTVSGGIVTATGACASIGGGSASATLQSAYDNSSVPQISLSSTGGALTVTDTAAGLGTDLLDVKDNTATTTYFGVSATGISVTGSGLFTAGVNISTGQTYKVNGTQIATSALSDVASITMQGNTFNGASQLVQLNGSTQLPAVSGTNLTNLNSSNLAAGSGAVTVASTTGALTLTSGSGIVVLGSNTVQRTAASLTLDVVNGTDSQLLVSNSGAGAANLSVDGGVAIGSGKAYSVGATAGISRSCVTGEYLDIINFVGGILSAGTCTTLPGAGGGATTTLNNLGTTAINAALIPAASSTNTLDLGVASTNLWRTAYFGTSVQSPLVQSAAGTGLTLNAANGTIILGTNTTTLQKAAASLTVDLATAAASTLTVTNSNASFVANLSVEGGVTIGSGQVFTVGATAGVSTTCSGGQFLQNQVTLGGITTSGTCAGAGASGDLQAAYAASSSPATIALNTSAKDFVINATDLATDPNILFNLQCTTCSAGGGKFAVQDNGTDVLTVNPVGSIVVAPIAGQNIAINLAGSSAVAINATGAPTTDMVTINNTGQPVATAGVSGLSITYVGGAGAIEASAQRIDTTPGATSGSTWNGLRIVNTTAAATGVALNGIKIEGPGAGGAGTDTALNIATGWDIGLNIQSGGIRMTSVSADPTGVTSGTLAVYARLVAGRSMLNIVGSAGVSTALQPSLFQQNVWMAQAGSANNTAQWQSQGAPGTYTTVPTLATAGTQATSFMANFATAATANTGNGFMQSTSSYFRGNADNGNNGFFTFSRVSFPGTLANYTSTTLGSRFWSGLTSQAALATMGASDAPTGDFAGFRLSGSASETTFRFLARNNATTTNQNTAVTLAVANTYDLYIYCKPYDSTNPTQNATIYWRIDNLSTGAAPVEGSQTLTLPTATTAMRYMTTLNTVNAAAKNLQIQRMYVETDR